MPSLDSGFTHLLASGMGIPRLMAAAINWTFGTGSSVRSQSLFEQLSHIYRIHESVAVPPPTMSA